MLELIYISDKKIPGLTFGEEYKGKYQSSYYKQMLTVKVGTGYRLLSADYFITKKEWRDLKLKRIFNEL